MPTDLNLRLDSAQRASLDALFMRTALADRRPAMSDHLLIDFRAGGGDGFVAATHSALPGGVPVAYAQASRANDADALEIVIDPAHRDRAASIGESLVTAIIGAIAERGGGRVNWWIHGTDALTTLADALGFAETRRLFKMGRPLPADRSADVDTRAFVIGSDEDDWVRVNNRAFAGHGEQGGWTVDTLRAREQETWFDPSGFRIHERDGEMAAFCWTKVHEPTDWEPARIGEIYVIAVDPAYHGHGLGSQLTLAGLDHMTGIGIEQAILYVDAANTAAVRLYERLGFRTQTISSAHTLEVPSTSESGGTR